MSRKLHVYDGATVSVTYDASRCFHSGHCVRHLPDVFNTAARPWVQPDNGDAARVLEIVAGCPSGALHATHRDGATADTLAPDAAVSLRLMQNGPIILRGDVVIVDGNDVPLLQDARVALCRCGQSKNKPFCDNSHRTAGWTDTPPTA